MSVGMDLDALAQKAAAHDTWAVSRLISLFEDQRSGAARGRIAALEAVDAACAGAGRGPGRVLGITGTPGSGKSTLLARAATQLLGRHDDLSVAIVAVDPSSEVSGGALLGDRTRMHLPRTNRVFFRSQASANDLGGLGPSTYQVVTLLQRLFDLVLVETVGIGQSEADVRHLAERVYLVLQPLGGDEVQFLKAGIIEHPDVFVLNKSDQPAATTMYHQLKGSLWLARPFEEEQPPVLRVSALTGTGIDDLLDDMANPHGGAGAGPEPAEAVGSSNPANDAAAYFFRRWVNEEWGRHGERFVERSLGGFDEHVRACGGYNAATLDLEARAGRTVDQHGIPLGLSPTWTT
ncbi:MAG TPA: hypothetical protein PLS63_11795 [Microthrixaceae bacterium]|nr:hypothetical protein [Microthrixaceae bacterium]